ncbi:hypothetical protein B0H21DRAFT_234360 [Amylocystis lapponica]|nr:hypothetical protein B0H21DRAFT_234360 [Amylocystis lapponica]
MVARDKERPATGGRRSCRCLFTGACRVSAPPSTLGRRMAQSLTQSQGDMAFFARPSSSAVKIVAPSSDEPPSPPRSTPKKDSTQRQCRNILIYGCVLSSPLG